MNCTTTRECGAMWGFLLRMWGNETLESRKDTSSNIVEEKYSQTESVDNDTKSDRELVSPDEDFEWIGLGVKFPEK